MLMRMDEVFIWEFVISLRRNLSIRLYFANNSLTQTLIRSLSAHSKVYI
jgi:hypothetical protein